MAKITPLLRTYAANGKSEYPIYIRVASGGKTRYLSLKERVRPSQWNKKKGRVRKAHKRAAEMNRLIEKALSAGRDEKYRLKIEGEPITAARLKEHIQEAVFPEEVSRAPENDFFAFAEEVVREMERREQLLTAKRYRSVLRMFKAFAGAPLAFEEVDVGLLERWDTALVERGNKKNTRHSKFRVIRTVLNKAIDRGRCPQDGYPFRSFSISRERVERLRLSYGEVRRMEGLDLAEGSLSWHVRNYFLFSFYCAGIRFRDVATMERRNVKAGRLRYRMSKTKKVKEMKLPGPAEKIASWYLHRKRAEEGGGGSHSAGGYLFRILEGYDTSTPAGLNRAVASQNALVNKYLKKIASQCGLPEGLSFHVSRHSFADYARQEGWSVYDISKALAHSNLRVTERYLKGFDAEGLDRKMENLFSPNS